MSTNDSLVTVARHKIKRNLRQSGMPEFIINRERLRYHVEDDGGEQATLDAVDRAGEADD